MFYQKQTLEKYQEGLLENLLCLSILRIYIDVIDHCVLQERELCKYIINGEAYFVKILKNTACCRKYIPSSRHTLFPLQLELKLPQRQDDHHGRP